MQVAAVDDVEQLGVAVGDGRQVGVGDHDLLGLNDFPALPMRLFSFSGRESPTSPLHMVIVGHCQVGEPGR